MTGQTVLLIEHSWRMRKLIRTNLEAIGLQVGEAVNSKNGLEYLKEGRPDLIFLDLDLPDGGAAKLLETVHARFAASPVPVILISAELPGRKFLAKARASGHLLKPFGVPSLLAQVRRQLDP
jgi:DNA-binding response OmpR family regulator